MKKILVTGGNGFIGKNFIEIYGKKYDICAPSSADMDLTRFEQVNAVFKENKFDAVVHAAGKHDNRSDAMLEADNLIMFKNVQYASALHGVKKLIVIGDAADMDISRPMTNVTEDAFGESVPRSGYGLGRYMITKLAEKDKISTVLRFFDIYGKGAAMENSRTTEILSHAVTGKKQIEVLKDKTFSTVYIDDACKIISMFLDKDYKKGCYNIANPTPVTYSDFAKKAKSYAKKDERILELNIGKESENILTASVDKLIDIVGQFKFTAFGTGVNKTLDYYKSHKSQLRAKDKDDK